MPTVMRIEGMRVMIYTQDHPPAHVHVLAGSGEAQFWLNCPDGPPTLRNNYGLSLAQVRRAEAALAGAVRGACREWELIHGHH